MGRAFLSSCLPLVHAHASSPRPHAGTWSLDDLSGRLVELSAGLHAAHLTAAFGLVLHAQLRGDRAAWVTPIDSSFFPPDVAESGVDLEALPVVRVTDGRMAARAADQLVRSGGFGLVVIDLSGSRHPERRWECDVPVPQLTRLLGLARQQDAAVVLLTKKSREMPSLHSIVS